MTGNRADRVLIRAKDLTLIVAVLTVAGALYAMTSKPAQWDQATRDIEELKPKVAANEIKLAVINAQYEAIQGELHAINRKLGR